MSGSDPHAAYSALGVRRVINASDTLTRLGGGRLSPAVRAAMTDAADHHVDVAELLAAAGRELAVLTRNPAAHVVAGAAAGLTVTAAAVMAGDDPGQVDQLPDTAGMRDEFVVLRCQRNPYDRAILAAGGKLREVGFADSTPPGQIERAITERTAALVWYAGTQFERYSPSLEDVATITRDRGIPLIVDAAAQIPPVENLWRYRERGADLVVFSGGKGLRGPQASGLIVGSEELVDACARNSYPHHSVGRATKTSKENVLGFLAAVREALEVDESAEYERMAVELSAIEASLKPLEAVGTTLLASGRLGQRYPRLEVRWATGPDTGEVVAALSAGAPAIEVGVSDSAPRTIVINPYSLLPGESEIIAHRLTEALERSVRERDI